MREFLRMLFAGERRKKKACVVVERRQRVTRETASKAMYESIDRFSMSVDRLKERVAK